MSRIGLIGVAGVLGFGLAHATLADDTGALVAQGEEVFGRVCFECHNATRPNPDMIAPPIFAAKNHYSGFGSREDFVAAVSGFLLDPQEETARMPGAIGQFGLMPPPEVTPEEAIAVAEYLYATDFTLPDWYLKHYEEEHGEAPTGN